MDIAPAKTFLHINAESSWGSGAMHITPNYPVTIFWNRAEIKVSACLVFLRRWDKEFAEYHPTPPDETNGRFQKSMS